MLYICKSNMSHFMGGRDYYFPNYFGGNKNTLLREVFENIGFSWTSKYLEGKKTHYTEELSE